MEMRSETWKYLGSFLAASVFSLAMIPLASAGDGVIEINQAKAEAGGVTAGDGEGFPVTVSEPGSYRLTGNLTVPDENTTAIEISADDVSIDLNGFSIIGPNTCTVTATSPTSVSCSANGTGRGIAGTGGFAPEDVAVSNGTVRGMGAEGIGFIFGRIERVRAISNGASGIKIPFGFAVDGPSAGAIISGVWAVRNLTDGINAGERATVTGSVASFNGNGGISAGQDCTVSGNTLNNNRNFGLEAAGTIVNNTVSANGGNGIAAMGTVIGNTVQNNLGFGLILNAAGYADNVINGNGLGTVVGGVQMGTNICDSDTTCP